MHDTHRRGQGDAVKGGIGMIRMFQVQSSFEYLLFHGAAEMVSLRGTVAVVLQDS